MPPRGKGPSPWMLLGLGLVVPGLGHLLTGRRTKAALFFGTIVATFAFGWGVTRGECVSFERHPVAFLGQAGAAGPTAVALLAGRGRAERLWLEALIERGAISGGAASQVPVGRGPAVFRRVVRDRLGVSEEELQNAYWESSRRAPRRADIGLLFTMIAGLLNLLVAFDGAERRARPASRDDQPPGGA